MLRIGIPMSSGKTQTYINTAYLDWIYDTGTLTPVPLTKRDCDKGTVAALDGLILPGGIDIDPIYYGEDNFSSYGTDPEKDGFERSLFHMFQEARKPIFGVCRGFQLVAKEFILYFKGAEDLLFFSPHISGHNQIDSQKLERNQHVHYLECFSDMLYLGEATQKITQMPVNSMHHQGLILTKPKKNQQPSQTAKTIRKYFTPIAWTDRGLKENETDKVICEAFEIKNWGCPILCVQWHPEELRDTQLIGRFFQRSCIEKPTTTHGAEGVATNGA